MVLSTMIVWLNTRFHKALPRNRMVLSELENIQQLKKLLAEHVLNDCF